MQQEMGQWHISRNRRGGGGGGAHQWIWDVWIKFWACSQRSESRSESCFGSRSASWLGSWFELCASWSRTGSGHCEVVLFLLHWLTLWPMHGFSAHFQIVNKCTTQLSLRCTCTIHVPKEFWVNKSSESGFLGGSRSKMPLFCISKAWLEKALHSQRVKSGFEIRKGSESQSEMVFGKWFAPLRTGSLS